MRRTHLQPVGDPPDHLAKRTLRGSAVQRPLPIPEKITHAYHPTLTHRSRALKALRQPQQALTPRVHFGIARDDEANISLRLINRGNKLAQLYCQQVTNNPLRKLPAADDGCITPFHLTAIDNAPGARLAKQP